MTITTNYKKLDSDLEHAIRLLKSSVFPALNGAIQECQMDRLVWEQYGKTLNAQLETLINVTTELELAQFSACVNTREGKK